MELIGISVGDLIDGMTIVEFTGEGNETVSVRMVTKNGLERERAILRARQILVQLTAFGEAAEIEDAETQGVEAGLEQSDGSSPAQFSHRTTSASVPTGDV